MPTKPTKKPNVRKAYPHVGTPRAQAVLDLYNRKRSTNKLPGTLALGNKQERPQRVEPRAIQSVTD